MCTFLIFTHRVKANINMTNSFYITSCCHDFNLDMSHVELLQLLRIETMKSDITKI